MKDKILSRLQDSMNTVRETDINRIVNDAKAKIEDIAKNPSKYMVELVMQAKLAYEMLLCYINKECSFPWKSVVALLAVLLYLINPLDIIPDFIPGIGYIDDLAAFGLAFSLIRDDLRQYAVSKNLNLKDYGLDIEEPDELIS